MDVCVIGLGYIGLPTAAMFASNGHKVVGVDTDVDVLEDIKQRGAPSEEPGLPELVQEVITTGKLTLSPRPETSDVFIICLPTPVLEDKTPDLSFVEKGMEAILDVLKKGDMVILESTVPPGTTAVMLADMMKQVGLDPNEDIDLAFAPERVIPGNILEELRNLDRVMGGLTSRAAERARDLYKCFVKGEIFLTDATTAEFVKLVENSYRDVNIAFANELAILSKDFGVNVWEAIEIANKHPRVNIHRPGPGVGGHCIAVDPYFIIDRAGGKARILSTARVVNASMPDFVVDQVEQMLNGLSGKNIALLGIAYKGNVGDPRESPAIDIIKGLESRGARWKAHDPHVTDSPIDLTSLEDTLRHSDLVIITTDHQAFERLDPVELGKLVSQKKVFDTRNILDRTKWQNAGWVVSYIGDGSG
jgi:UDP-N-acetyl-D-mannosaminuronic acid dehydrogenase